MRANKFLSSILIRKAYDNLCRTVAEGNMPRCFAWLVILGAFGYGALALALTFLPTRLSSAAVVASGLVLIPLFWCFSVIARMDVRMMSPFRFPTDAQLVLTGVVYGILALFAWHSGGDTEWQWAQATGAVPFDDWHPVLHTFILSMFAHCGFTFRFVVLVQVELFVLILRFVLRALGAYRYDGRICTIWFLLVVFSPLGLVVLCTLMKDSFFALAGLAMVGILIHLVETEGSWLTPVRSVVMAAVLFLLTFLRHNGFFFSLPILVLLPFVCRRISVRPLVTVVCLTIGLCAGYVGLRGCMTQKGMIHVGAQDQRFSESVGIPLAVMAESYVNFPETTPMGVREIMEKVCSREKWLELYSGELNSIKWYVKTGPAVNSVSHIEFFSLFEQVVRANPVMAVKAILHDTSAAWSVSPENPETILIDAAIRHAGGPVRSFLNGWRIFCVHNAIGAFLSAPGTWAMGLVLAFGIGMVRNFRRSLLLGIPMLCYHFGTMFFLCGFDYRFFFITVLCAGPLTLCLLRRNYGR